MTGFAKHYQTGEPLPDGVFEKLLALKHYNAGLGMLRQLYFGECPNNLITVDSPLAYKEPLSTRLGCSFCPCLLLTAGKLDMELHSSFDPESTKESIFDVQQRVAKQYTVLKPLEEVGWGGQA